MTRGDLPARLLAAFLSEFGEQLANLESALLALESNPDDPECVRTIFRISHTLKGAARAANVPLVESSFHSLESLLARAQSGEIEISPGDIELFFKALDALREVRERIQAGRPLAGSPLDALQPDLARAGLPPHDSPTKPGTFEPQVGRESARSPIPSPSDGPLPDRPMRPIETSPDRVRVQTEKIDALLATAGELLLLVRRISMRRSRLEDLHRAVSRTGSEWAGARRRLRVTLEKEKLQGSIPRSLQESERRIDRILREVADVTTDWMREGRELTQLADILGESVRRVRMRPFGEACEALPRVIRDLERTTGKAVELSITGTDVEVGGTVLDGLREALLHLVRNAVDHGVEPPEERRRIGKPATGAVTIAAALVRGHVRVTVADDGRGLNAVAIREQLRLRGRGSTGADTELGRELLTGGISTSRSLTEVSGRGVGLDAVRTAMERMGGSVAVEWVEGQRTLFTLECPPTVTTIRALLAKIGSIFVAIPSVDVERLLRLRSEDLRQMEGRLVLPDPDRPIPVVSLPTVLGPELPPLIDDGTLYGIELKKENQRLIVAVEGLDSEEEIIVRSPDRVRNLPAALSGVSLLPSGDVALVLNPSAIIGIGIQTREASDLGTSRSRGAGPRQPRILVADDSITTRTLEQSILEAAGYDVVTAVDGVDALQILQTRPCDLVVSDVEMPRLDGFGLCETIRRTPGLQRVPIVLVTALEKPEHRARGLQAGADAYFPKASFDQEELLKIIQQLLG